MSLQFIIVEMAQEFAIVTKDQIPGQIDRHLDRTSQIMGATSAGLFLINPRKTRIQLHVAVGKASDIASSFQNIAAVNYKWMLGQFEDQLGFTIDSDSWPDSEMESVALFKRLGCKSVLVQPVVEGSLKGFCFWGSEKAVNWSRGELMTLRQLTNILGIALKRY